MTVDLSASPEHKLIFALVIIIVVLLVVLAVYINYEYVAKERGQSVIADLDVGFEAYKIA